MVARSKQREKGWRVLVMGLLVLGLAGGAQGLESALVLGEFEGDVSGFDGAAECATDGAKEGKGCLRLTNPGPKWVSTKKSVGGVFQDLEKLRFWVKSTDAGNLALRLTDSTGQQFQQRLQFKTDGAWQEIQVTDFTKGQSWGGAEDKKWHGPLSRVDLILEHPGTVYVDQIVADLKPEILPAMKELAETYANAKSVTLASFDEGTDGFGGFEHDKGKAQAGAGCAKLVNVKERWVTAGKNMAGLKNDFLEFSFYVRSSDVDGIAVRFKDSTGQDFQHRLKFKNDGEWHRLTVADLTAGRSWGGAEDKKWHAPAQAITFILEAVGTVWIDEVQAKLSPEKIVSTLEVIQTQPAGVYLAGEEVVLPLESTAEAIEYTITDFWNRSIASGELMPDAKGQAQLRPPAQNGYFLVRLVARKGGEAVADQFTSYAVVAPFQPQDPASSPYGAMTHFAQGMSPAILPILKKAGIVSVRDEHYWNQVEKERGKFAFSGRSDGYMAAAQKHGIDPLVAMTFANDLYDGGLTPHTPEGCDAYGRYGQAILKQYGEQVRWLEIWNEYNGTWCKGPAASDRPKYYTQMLKHAYERIKEVRPDVKVLGCATVVIPMPYIEGIFKHGGLKYMDAVVLHPYRAAPEGVEVEVGEVEELIRKYNDGQDKPIWITETGKMDKSEYEWETGRKTYEKGRRWAATYLARQYALLLTRNVEKIYWYLAADHLNFVSMGLLRNENEPSGMGSFAVAPPYVSYATLIRELDQPEFVARETTGSKFTYILHFRSKGRDVRVCWATQPAHVALRVPGPTTVVDMMGAETVLEPVSGRIYLTLSGEPMYVRGPVDAVEEKGGFELAAEQTVDMLDRYGIAYKLDAGTGEIEIAGQTLPVAAPGGRVELPDQQTNALRSDRHWYRLRLDGKPVATGQLAVSVVDPLAFRVPPALEHGAALKTVLDNTSERVDYTIESVALNARGKKSELSVQTSVAAGKGIVCRLPLEAMPPYVETPLTVQVMLQGRAPLTTETLVSHNPILKRTIAVDGKQDEWNGIPAIDLARQGRVLGRTSAAGTVKLAWDERGLYVATDVRDATDLRIAVAPETDRAWSRSGDLTGYVELGLNTDLKLHLSPAGMTELPGAQVAGEGGTLEVYLPWATLPGVDSEAGRLRLALFASDGKGSLSWGDGMAMGKSPDGFRSCRLVEKDESTTAVVATETVALEASTRQVGETIADSEVDYSKDQGKNNWYYGFYLGKGDGLGNGLAPSGPYTDDDFGLMEHVQTMWGYTYQGPVKYLAMSRENVHPEVAGDRQVWAVRRWKSDVDGKVRLTGVFSHDAKGDGIEGRILVDGIQVYGQHIGGEGDRPREGVFDLVVPVQAGSLVDFAVTPGPAGSRQHFDNSSFRARIQKMR